jgi:hypothetical protein
MTLPTSIVFAVAGVVFLVLASARLVRDHWRLAPASRTWFLVGGIFTLVAVWLSVSR